MSVFFFSVRAVNAIHIDGLVFIGTVDVKIYFFSLFYGNDRPINNVFGVRVHDL